MKPDMLQQSKNRFFPLTMFVVIALAPAVLFGADSWTDLKFPVRETVTGISFVSPSTGYAVTSGGKYARTLDSGNTWKAFVLSKEEPPYDDVFFLNKDTGIICGRNGFVARTIDGCKNWTRTFWGDTMIAFTSVAIMSKNAAVMIGLKPGDLPRGVIFRSPNAGQDWVQLPDSGFGFGELYYHKGDPLCFQSYGKLHYSVDSGKTWSTLNTGSGKAGRATAFYGQTGIICGNMAMIAVSSDRGRNWNPITMDKPEIHFTSVVLLDEKTAYIVGTAGTVMKTVDGGTVWSPELAMTEPVDFACMHLVGDYLYIGGADGVILRKKVR
jgi:photosystem II stability/assembly factor-like uncharacterized protein